MAQPNRGFGQYPNSASWQPGAIPRNSGGPPPTNIGASGAPGMMPPTSIPQSGGFTPYSQGPPTSTGAPPGDMSQSGGYLQSGQQNLAPPTKPGPPPSGINGGTPPQFTPAQRPNMGVPHTNFPSPSGFGSGPPPPPTSTNYLSNGLPPQQHAPGRASFGNAPGVGQLQRGPPYSTGIPPPPSQFGGPPSAPPAGGYPPPTFGPGFVPPGGQYSPAPGSALGPPPPQYPSPGGPVPSGINSALGPPPFPGQMAAPGGQMAGPSYPGYNANPAGYGSPASYYPPGSVPTVPPGQLPPGQAPGGQLARRPSDPKQKIDPSQIPRPQVTREIVKYVTRGRTLTTPPPATSDFVVIDEGNCSPRFIRPTLNHIPVTKDMFNNCRIPVAAVIQPMAAPAAGESPIPVIDFGPRGPIRCTRCSAYINPFMKWTQGGRKFQCNICGLQNDAPEDYQCHPDEFGRRRDAYEHPELSRGSVDFAVSKDYSVRPPQEPIYVFVIDVSVHAVGSGLLTTVLESIRENLDLLPGNDRTRVGIITFDRQIHYYNLDERLADPAVVVAPDIDEPFSPIPPQSWLVNVRQQRAKIDALLDMIPDLYAANIAVDSALGSAIGSTIRSLQQLGGKIFVFQCCLPRCGMGLLADREAARHYGTERERSLYMADEKNEFWRKFGEEAAVRQVSVDMFVIGNYFADIATTTQLCSASGGQTYYYPQWRMEPGSNNAEVKSKLKHELAHNLKRLQAYESVLKVRCSTGMEVEEYLGHFTKRMLQEIDIATIDEDQTFVVSFAYTDHLEENGDFHIQCALLHTNSSGLRCVRVHNLALPVSNLLANVFRYADLEAICTLFEKRAIKTALAKDLSFVREELVQNCVEILFQYRKHCAAQSSSGQLILPESLKLFPLYTLGTMKCNAFRRNDAGMQSRNAVEVRADERAFLFNLLGNTSVRQGIPFSYPNFYALHELPDECGTIDGNERVILPPARQPSSEQLRDDGIFLLDDSMQIYLYVAAKADPALVKTLFGEERIDTAEKLVTLLPHQPGSGDLLDRVHNIIQYLRKGRPVYQELCIITRTDWRSGKFMSKLVEDRTKADISYVEFLCLIHKKIQAKFL